MRAATVPADHDRPTTHRDLALSVVGLVLAATSPLALVVEKVFDVSLHDTVPFVALPAAVVLVALAAVSRRRGARRLGACLLLGAALGLPATALYDGLRLAHLNVAEGHDEAQGFGARILDASVHDTMSDGHGDSMAADHDSMDARSAPTDAASPGHGPSRGARIVVGYLYHYWNGVVFATAFLLLFGRYRPWLAIPFMSLVVYGGMLAVMSVEGGLAGFAFELAGHLGFGVLLAVGAARYLGSHHGAPAWRLAAV